MADSSTFDPALFRLWSLVRDCARGIRAVTVLSGERVRRPPADDALQSHPVPTIVAALAGVVRIELGPREAIDLHAGDVLALDAGVWHRHARLRAGAVTYDQGFMPQASDLVISSPERSWSAAIPRQPSRGIAARLLAARSAEQRRVLAAELLSQLEHSPASPLKPRHPAVERMARFLRMNRHRPVGASDMVRASGLRPSHAHELFKREYGLTPKQILLRDRLLLARALLAAGVGIAETAARCGFTGSPDLSRAFRRRYGLSPRTWLAAGAPRAE